MAEQTILLQEIIGKALTDIRCKYGKEQGWLDTAECFIELDHTFFIDIPLGETYDVLMVSVDPQAESIFKDFSKARINKEGFQRSLQGLFNRVSKAFFGAPEDVREHLLGRTIVDYLWKPEETENGIFELDNGYFISSQYMAPHGTGMAGLHCYNSLVHLKERRGNDLKRYSETSKQGLF